jgi:hypothetical protein
MRERAIARPVVEEARLGFSLEHPWLYLFSRLLIVAWVVTALAMIPVLNQWSDQEWGKIGTNFAAAMRR